MSSSFLSFSELFSSSIDLSSDVFLICMSLIEDVVIAPTNVTPAATKKGIRYRYLPEDPAS